MYARVRPSANQRDVAYTRRDARRLRRALRLHRAAVAGATAWWLALLVVLAVIAFALGYLAPIAFAVWGDLP